MHLNPRKVMVIRGVEVFNVDDSFKFIGGDWRYDPITTSCFYKKARRKTMIRRPMSQKVKAILFMYDIIV